MPIKPNWNARSGAIIFMLGAILGAWLFGVSTWAQFEASLFDADMVGASTLPQVCPRFISRDETGQVHITLHNPTEKDHARFLRTHITAGYVTLMHEDARLEEVPAGESLTLSWPVTTKNAVYGGRMIFFRSFVVGRAPLPSAGNVCGIYVVNTPFGLSGTAFMWLAIGISLLGMGGGIWLWQRSQPRQTRHALNLQRGMKMLAAVIAAGLGLMVLGAWFFAGIALLLALLLALALLTPLFLGQG